MNNFKEICEKFDASVLQQLYKKITDDDGKISDKSVFPVALVQSVFDAISGMRLDDILSHYNYLYVQYKGTDQLTRLAVPIAHRRKSLILSYTNYEGNMMVEQYVGKNLNDEDWQDTNNWKTPFTEGNFIVHVTKEELEAVIDMDEINNLIQDIINNIDYEGIAGPKLDVAIDNYLREKDEIVIDSINNYLNEHLTDEQLAYLISKAVQENILTAIDEYFKTDEGKEALVDAIQPILEETVGEFFNAVKRYIEDNERVIANALARHEQAITDLQNS